MAYPPGGQPPDDRPQYPQQPSPGYPGPGQPAPPPGQGYPAPGYPPWGYPPPPRKSNTGLIVGLVVIVALVIAGAVIAGFFLTSQGRGPLASDEKRIELAIRDFYETLDSRGFRAAAELACTRERATFEAMTEQEKSEFDSTSVSVTIDRIEDIVVIDDTATAKVTGKLTVEVPGRQPNTETSTTEHLKKEDGKWKICSAEGTR